MDIVTHVLSGAALGTVVASFSNKLSNRLWIVSLSGFAAALPDIDAISLWSRFDSTIGTLFNLPHSGKHIYSAKLWYSHHGFFHSLVAGVLLAILVGIVCYLINAKFHKIRLGELIGSFKIRKLLLIGFILGFIIHLLEDMPTPSSAWGGVNLFWPAESYIGGTGQIWWWNNYDIFLIVLSVLVINTAILLFKKLFRFDIRKITASVFIAGFIFVNLQINTRNYDFEYSGHTNRYNEYEAKSKELQKDILGDRTYNLMEWFDKKMKVQF